MSNRNQDEIDDDLIDALSAPKDMPPALLDRLELHTVAREEGLTTRAITQVLARILKGDNDANAMRAIEIAERLSRPLDGGGGGGRTTINGDVTFAPNFVALESALSGVDAETRRRVLDAVSQQGQVIDVESLQNGS